MIVVGEEGYIGQVAYFVGQVAYFSEHAHRARELVPLCTENPRRGIPGNRASGKPTARKLKHACAHKKRAGAIRHGPASTG
jgi:hypothetical protein